MVKINPTNAPVHSKQATAKKPTNKGTLSLEAYLRKQGTPVYKRRAILCLRPNPDLARTEKQHDSENYAIGIGIGCDGTLAEFKEEYYAHRKNLPLFNGKRPRVFFKEWTCYKCGENTTQCAQLENKAPPKHWSCTDCEVDYSVLRTFYRKRE